MDRCIHCPFCFFLPMLGFDDDYDDDAPAAAETSLRIQSDGRINARRNE